MLRLSLPMLSIALTLYQLPRVIEYRGQQPFRSLVASFDILLATFTSNALVLVSLLQDRGYKKSKYKVQPSTYENRNALTKTPTAGGGRRPSRWGSDEDLISEGKEGTGVIAMEVYPSSASRGKGSADGGRTSPVIEEPAKVKLQEIRVAQTWQITVEDDVKDREIRDHRD
ncbi:hypothetical protein IFR05_014504 [Cadophora sp. M221]|nr:hypothetical protein IFR05_014504 [Cadophora sp. M221]